ncbi:MAG: RidA family protein [Halopenitus sp.]
MEKTVILPEDRTIAAADGTDPASSYGVVTQHSGYRRVVFSGSCVPEGDAPEQVRRILTHKRFALEDLGGSMDDVVSMQCFVRSDVLSRDTQTAIHEVRHEFFTRPHLPASTMVGVASLLDPDALVEIELEAEIPDDEWETQVLTGD